MERDVDWKNLAMQEAPYLPEESQQLDTILHLIENTSSSSPEYPQLIRLLVKNFDDYPDRPIESKEFASFET